MSPENKKGKDDIKKIAEAIEKENVGKGYCNSCELVCELKGRERVTSDEFKKIEQPEKCPILENLMIDISKLAKTIEEMDLVTKPILERISRIQDEILSSSMLQKNEFNEVMKEQIEQFSKTIQPMINLTNVVTQMTADILPEDLINLLQDNPNIVHYEQVKRAYEEKHYGVVIILLSTFFESFSTTIVKNHIKKVKPKKTKGSIKTLVEEKMDFDEKLRYIRIMNLINENDFAVVNSVKSARNDFAHDLNAFSISESKEILENVRLEEAIRVYEEILKIDRSMLDLNDEK